MLKSVLVSVILQASVIMTCIGGETAKFQILRNSIVNDEIVDGIEPFGVVKCKNGDWVAVFQDKGDSTAGCTAYFVRSTDQGKTWSKPFKTVKSDNDADGMAVKLFSLPNGENYAIFVRIHHADKNRTGYRGHRQTTLTFYKCNDDFEIFEEMQKIEAPLKTILFPNGNLVELKNGDLIIPSYKYVRPTQNSGVVCDSGLLRSNNGGKTWTFELVFKEPDPAHIKNFTESAFAVKADGTIVGFARVDSTKTKNMWKVVSKDNGASWSVPEETKIRAIYPLITRLDNGKYVMICGVLSINPPRTTGVMVSDDGENYTYAGQAFYTRTGGRSYNTATGGSQAFLKVDKNKLFITFYACDPKLPGYHHTYIDGNLIEVN